MGVFIPPLSGSTQSEGNLNRIHTIITDKDIQKIGNHTLPGSFKSSDFEHLTTDDLETVYKFMREISFHDDVLAFINDKVTDDLEVVEIPLTDIPKQTVDFLLNLAKNNINAEELKDLSNKTIDNINQHAVIEKIVSARQKPPSQISENIAVVVHKALPLAEEKPIEIPPLQIHRAFALPSFEKGVNLREIPSIILQGLKKAFAIFKAVIGFSKDIEPKNPDYKRIKTIESTFVPRSPLRYIIGEKNARLPDVLKSQYQGFSEELGRIIQNNTDSNVVARANKLKRSIDEELQYNQR